MSDSDTSPAILLHRLRRAERVTGLVGVGVAVVVAILLWASATIGVGSTSWKIATYSVGLGCTAAAATLAVLSFSLFTPLPYTQGVDASSLKRIRRAVISGDESALDIQEASHAPRWAAAMALILREQLVGSVLFVVGLTCTIVLPGATSDPPNPLFWIIGTVLFATLAMNIGLLCRQRKMHHFATRHRAWEL